MAYREFKTNDPHTREQWGTIVEKYEEAATAFKEDRDCSSTSGKARILYKDELKEVKTKGDKIEIEAVDVFQQEGKIDDETVEGTGEAIRAYKQEVTIGQIRHGSESDGALSDKRTVIKFRETASANLGPWMGLKKDGLRRLLINGLSPAQVCNDYEEIRWSNAQFQRFLGKKLIPVDAAHKVWVNDDRASIATIAEDDTPSLALLYKIQAKISRMARKPKPFIVDGKKMYLLDVDDVVMALFKQEQKFRDLFISAAAKSDKNPIITGAIGTVENFIFRSQDQLLRPTGAAVAGEGNVSRIIISGADDLLEARAKGKTCGGDSLMGWFEGKLDADAVDMIYVAHMTGAVKNTHLDEDKEDTIANRVWRNSLACDVYAKLA